MKGSEVKITMTILFALHFCLVDTLCYSQVVSKKTAKGFMATFVTCVGRF